MDLFSNVDPDDVINEMTKLIGPDWVKALNNSNVLFNMYTILNNIKDIEETYGTKCYPSHDDCLRSMRMIKPSDVKAVIISKCPYPNDNADGIPFSCAKEYSESLKQIYFGCSSVINISNTGDLSKYPMTLDHWVEQGVLLLNVKHRVLENDPDSFKDTPWSEFIEYIVKVLHFKIDKDIKYFSWGSDATDVLKRVKKSIKSKDFKYYTEEHPISAARNYRYWVCDHFNIINKQLTDKNEEPIKWY